LHKRGNCGVRASLALDVVQGRTNFSGGQGCVALDASGERNSRPTRGARARHPKATSLTSAKGLGASAASRGHDWGRAGDAFVRFAPGTGIHLCSSEARGVCREHIAGAGAL
jgi:hypothetical protein